MNRKTLIAGGVFVGLGVAAVAVVQSPEKGERKGEAPRPIPKLNAGDFDTVEVSKGGKTTVIRNEGSKFEITSPVAYRADQDAAKQAFEALEKLEFGHIVSDQKSKQDEYELGANSARVVAKKGEKAVADLRIGKVANNTTLVRHDGTDQIWQARGSLKFTFDKEASAWRDKTIVSLQEPDVQSLEIVSRGGGKIALRRASGQDAGGGTEWTVVESTAKVDPLDKAVAPALVSALSSWKTNDFADNAKPDETGLDAPVLTVTVGVKDGSKKTVLIGNKKGEDEFFVRTADSPQVFLVKKYNLDRINKRPIEFRDKTICNVAEGDIVEVVVNRDKDPITLLRDSKKSGPEAWKLSRPVDVALDTSKVSGLVGAFKDWKATSFAEDSTPRSTGLDKPSSSINVRTGSKGAGCVVRIGAETSDKQSYFVEKAGSPDIFVAPKWSVERLMPKLDELKKKSGS